MANTTRFMIEIPDVGADADMWGTILNNYFNALEPKIFDRAGDTVSGPLTVTGLTSVDALTATGVITGNGSGLTNLNAANIATGIIGNARTTATFNATANTIVLRGAQGGFSANLVNVTGLTSTGTVNTPTVNGATTLALQTAGVDRVTLTQGGNLLVGTNLDAGNRISAQVTSSGVFQGAYTASNGADSDFTVRIRTNETQIANSTGGGVLSFATVNTERARITSGGFLKASNTGTYVSGNAGFHEFDSSAAFTLVAYGTATSGGTSVVYSESITANAYLNLYEGRNGNAQVFRVAANGQISSTSTTITSISDQRMKENIRPLSDGLAAINALQPRMFDWKEGKGRNVKNDRGFIAQEFETVFPDMIEEWKDGDETYKALRADLIPVLVKAVQELSAQNAALTDRIAALEAAK